MRLRYSSSVVAPMHCISPLASAGFNIFAASIAPSAAPAPINVCSSSMNRMTSFLSRISRITPFRRSSNSPRYFAPAIMLPKSSEMSVLSSSISGTLPETMFCASPSATTVLPTPGSPTSTGLFLVLRERISTTAAISLSLPITGSSSPAFAAAVKSRPYFCSRDLPSSFSSITSASSARGCT